MKVIALLCLWLPWACVMVMELLCYGEVAAITLAFTFFPVSLFVPMIMVSLWCCKLYLALAAQSRASYSDATDSTGGLKSWPLVGILNGRNAWLNCAGGESCVAEERVFFSCYSCCCCNCVATLGIAVRLFLHFQPFWDSLAAASDLLLGFGGFLLLSLWLTKDQQSDPAETTSEALELFSRKNKPSQRQYEDWINSQPTHQKNHVK
ncbi:hypothetical protein Nepgr_013450 [Nepenthes gracilis]|uniref:Uncharacterized protein n=1 Tax=Nepenthes gracilis TaxID=150966 RepID=A0AAD3XP45_NEPGR|nr:hypothetical protein Nepgr_013450 [Nepenthes gracilis]